MLLGTICYPWCVSRRSAGDQPNRAPQGTEQPGNSPAPEFQPNTAPDHRDLDRSGAVARRRRRASRNS